MTCAIFWKFETDVAINIWNICLFWAVRITMFCKEFQCISLLHSAHYGDKFKTLAFWNGKQKPSKMIVGKNEMSHCSWHLQLREIFILGGKLAIMAMERSNPPWQQPHSFSSTQKNKMTWKKPKIYFYRPRGKISLSPGDISRRRAIFSEISAIYRKSRDIFKTIKYRDIWSAIFRLADISAILSTLL